MMLTQEELTKIKLTLTKNAIPFKFNNDRLITVPAVLAILELVTKKEWIGIPETATLLKK